MTGRLSHAVAVWRLCWYAGRWLTVAQLVCTLVTGLLPAALAWLTKLLVDTLVEGGSAVVWAGGLALIGLLTGVLPHVTGYLRAEQARRIDQVIQDRLYSAVCSFQGLSRLENPAFLDRLRMAMHATGGALEPASTGMFTLAGNVITLVSLFLTLTVLSPVMAGVVIVAAVPTLLAQLSLARKRVGMLMELTPASRRQFFYATLITDIQAAKEIRLFGLGGFLRGRLLTELGAVHAGERRIDRRILRVQSLLSLLAALVAGLGLVWAVHAAASGRLSLGDVSAFIAATAGTQAALVTLVSAASAAYQSLLMYGYFADVTSQPGDLAQPSQPAAVPVMSQGIELRDVWFRYDDEHSWVLRGVNLTIHHGQSTALVGVNGAGKSTIVKLLCRFYDPTRGAILWDGVDIRDVPPAELRQRMGVLFQDFMSYDLTAAENIGIGDVTALQDRPRVERAARAADIDTTIVALPKGYDTLLSRIFLTEQDKDNPDTGVLLSGGQWQRLALARTLMRDDRDLLILDEPSAGLDARAEHDIHHRLRTHRRDRTSLLISHRLGAVRDADHIAVLTDGRITEQGDHDFLMAAGGVYAELFSLQAEGYVRPGT